ncbi:MAG: copper resistance protein NlpE N-terminal domain-containing protein [Burkholderiales bacterium]|jgi:uncharacterized lipoprotein NlpE involved in copper resistance|nr:copper resistance protein NlpE N-terminal domain-containing protein [Burkholderiales bacterium]
MKKIVLSFAILIILTSCGKSKTSQTQEITADATLATPSVAQPSSLSGVYIGMLPCADCSGIRTELTLDENNTFVLKETYFKNGEQSAPEKTGRWTQSDKVIELTLPDNSADNERLCYGIRDTNVLVKYDIDCAPITGTTLDYSLVRQ